MRETKQFTFPIIEKFLSINGEGIRSGELSYFVRFASCNLSCPWCDTKYSWDKKTAVNEDMKAIAGEIKKSGATNVTLTGGEPLLQKDIYVLVDTLIKQGNKVEIETNGSIYFGDAGYNKNLSYCMDYKMPASGQFEKMETRNLPLLSKNDSIKFVCADKKDLEAARKIIKENGLTKQTNVLLSCVFQDLKPKEIVDFMKKHKLNGVRLQLQIHKFIWGTLKRGV